MRYWHRALARRFSAPWKGGDSVALSPQQLAQWMSQPLGDLDLRVVQIDGAHEHGVDRARHRRRGPEAHLGPRERTTESVAAVRPLLSDPIDRGLSPNRALLFAIDVAKALRKAITVVFRNSAIAQRCQVTSVEQRRNALEHLSERMRPNLRKPMQQAYPLRHGGRRAGLRRSPKINIDRGILHPRDANATLLMHRLTRERIRLGGTKNCVRCAPPDSTPAHSSMSKAVL